MSLRIIHHNIHVPEILHLLFVVWQALFMHGLICAIKFNVDVIAREKDDLEALVTFGVFNAPHAKLALLKVFPIDAEQILLSFA